MNLTPDSQPKSHKRDDHFNKHRRIETKAEGTPCGCRIKAIVAWRECTQTLARCGRESNESPERGLHDDGGWTQGASPRGQSPLAAADCRAMPLGDVSGSRLFAVNLCGLHIYDIFILLGYRNFFWEFLLATRLDFWFGCGILASSLIYNLGIYLKVHILN